MGPTFSAVWHRIESHAGQEFSTVTGLPFTYTIKHGALHPSRTNRAIPKADFERAFNRMPLDGTAGDRDLQGPSFVYAILMDERIRSGESGMRHAQRPAKLPDTDLSGDRDASRSLRSPAPKTIVLISCVSKKLNRRAHAEDFYTSDLFRKSLAYAHAAGIRRAGLSDFGRARLADVAAI